METRGFIHLNVHSHYSRGWGTAGIDELAGAASRMGIKTLALTDTNSLHGAVFFLEAAADAGISPILGSELKAGGRRAIALVKDLEGYGNLCRLVSDCCCREDLDLAYALRDKRRGLVVISDDPHVIKALSREGREDLYLELSPGFNMSGAYALSRKTGVAPVATNRVYMATREDFSLHRILRAVSLNTKLSRLKVGDTCTEQNFLAPATLMEDRFPHAPQALENTILIADMCLKDWDLGRIVFPRFSGMDDETAFKSLLKAVNEGCIGRYGTITPEVRARIDHEMAIIGEKGFAHYFLVVADITKRAGMSCGRGSAAASIAAYALGITQVDPIRHNLFFERFLNPGRMDPPDIDVDFAWDERDTILDYVFAAYGTRRAAMVANHNTFGARSAVREIAKVFGLSEEEIRRVTGKMSYGWRMSEMGEGIFDHPRMRASDFNGPWREIIRAAARLEAHFRNLSTHCGGVVVVPDDIRRYCPVEISAKGLQVLQWDKDSVEDGGLVKIDLLGNRSLAVIRDAISMISENYGRLIDYGSFNPIDDPATVSVFYRGDTMGVFYFESPATRQVLTKVGSGFTFEEYLKKDHFLLNVIVTSIIRPASNRSINEWITRLHGGQWSPPHPLLEPVLKETLGVMVFQEQLSRAAIHLAGFDASEADALRKVVSKKHREKKLRDFHARFAAGASAKGVDPKVVEEVWTMMMGFDGYSFCKPHSASYTMVSYKSAYLRAHYPAEFMAAVISNGGGYYSTLGYISEARRMGLKVFLPDINLSTIPYRGRQKEIRAGFMQIMDISREALEAVIHEREKNGPFLSFRDFLIRIYPGGAAISVVGHEDIRILIKTGCFDSLEGKDARPALIWEALAFFSARDDRGPDLFSGVRDSMTHGGGFSRPPVKKDAHGYGDGTASKHFARELEEAVMFPGFYVGEAGDRPGPERELSKYPKQISYPKETVRDVEKRPRRGPTIGCRDCGALGRRPNPPPYPPAVMLRHECETLGIPISFHPLDRYAERISSIPHVRAKDLKAFKGRFVATVGWQITGKTVHSRDGEPMKFVSFEDKTGIYETVLFPAVHKRFCHLLDASRAYLLKGRVEEDRGAVTLNISCLSWLDG